MNTRSCVCWNYWSNEALISIICRLMRPLYLHGDNFLSKFCEKMLHWKKNITVNMLSKACNHSSYGCFLDFCMIDEIKIIMQLGHFTKSKQTASSSRPLFCYLHTLVNLYIIFFSIQSISYPRWILIKCMQVTELNLRTETVIIKKKWKGWLRLCLQISLPVKVVF